MKANRLFISILMLIFWQFHKEVKAQSCPPGLLTADFSFSVSPPKCSYDLPINLVLINNSSGGGSSNATYYWSVNGTPFDTTTSTTTTVNYTINTVGTYIFTLIAEYNLTGCKDTIQYNFLVANPPNPAFSFSPGSPQCESSLPINLVLNNNTTSTTNIQFNWYVNSSLFATTYGNANTNYTLTTPGTYTFELEAIDTTTQCSTTVSQTYTVYALPTASFTQSADTICLMGTVDFTNTSTGLDATHYFNWDFGDGNTSTATDPSHTYTTSGNYNVVLTAGNGPTSLGCTTTYTRPLVVKDGPVASISGDDGDGDTKYCLPPADTTSQNTVVFTSSSTCPGGGCTYVWDFGDGNTYTTTQDTSVSHTYTSYGEFWASLTITHPNGCSHSDSVFVVFEPLFISASFVVPPADRTGCLPMTINITNINYTNATQFTWDFGDGNTLTTPADTTSFTYTYTTDGTYIVQLTATNACGTGFAAQGPIVVAPLVTASFTANPTVGCAPQTVNFDASASTNVQPNNNFYWDFGDGHDTSGVGIVSHTYDTVGIYNVMLVAYNACGSDTAYTTIYVDSIPEANIDAVPTEGCSPLTVNFTNNSETNTVSGSPVYVRWWIDGGYCCGPWWNTCGTHCANYSSWDIPPQTFTIPWPYGNVLQTHTVFYEIWNHCGRDDTIITITVHPPVVARFNMSATEICVGDSITFTNVSYGDSMTFEWDFGNGIVKYDTAMQANIELPISYTITYSVPDTYQVRLIAKGYCGTDTLIRQVIVHPYPVVDFTVDTTERCVDTAFVFTNNSTTGGTYAWSFSGGSPSSSTAYNPPPVYFPTAGNHTVTLTVTKYGCTASRDTIVTSHPLPNPTFTLSPTTGCSPLDVNYNNTSVNDPTFLYIWDFGNGSNDTIYNPVTITYTNPGTTPVTFTPTLTIVTDKNCRKTTTGTTITVNPIPVADFNPDTTKVCDGGLVYFFNNSTLGATYNWNFGTNAIPSTSTAFDPSPVLFTGVDTHLVTLTVTKYGCSDTDSVRIITEFTPIADFALNPSSGCTPLDVQIVNNTTFDSTFTYIWDYGNGIIDTAYNDTAYYTYTNSGTVDTNYTIRLIVSTSIGCSDTSTQLLNVAPLPIAQFSANKPTICQNEPLITTNTSVNATSYQWDFGDGNTSTQTNPTHLYANPGTYTVTLIATSGVGCQDTFTTNITVDTIPQAGFTHTIECVGNPTTFTDTSKGAVSWNWDFGDGNTSTLQNPTHLYASPGTYNTTLIVENIYGCRDTASAGVVVNDKPVADFSATTPCFGQATVFSDLTSGVPIAWNWDFGDGNNSTQQNPTHIYSSDGTYTVKLVVQSGIGCVDSITKTVTVRPVPVADFTADTVCAQDYSTTFINNTVGGNSYIWDFGDGSPTSNAVNPTHTYSNGGTYNVSLITENTVGCRDTVNKDVIVRDKPVADFSANQVCLNQPSQFTNLTNIPTTSWFWDFGDGNTSTLENPTHVYASYDTFAVTFIPTTQYGCSDTITKDVIVMPNPTANFYADTVCLTHPTTFTDSSIDAVSWTWDFADGNNSSAQNPTHTYANAGTYPVKLLVQNVHGCLDSITKDVIVRPNPTADFTVDTVCYTYTTTFTDQSLSAVSWFWNFGDSTTSTQQNPTHIYPAPDTFTVKLIVSNIYGCLDSTTKPAITLARPFANFGYTPTCAESPATFIDSTTGVVDTWNWDLGDGTITNVQNPVHVYAVGGYYNVELIAGNTYGCADTITKTIQVYTRPYPDFVADTVCLGNPTTFTNLSQDSVTMNFFWDFGDGNNSLSQDPQYIYADSGVYSVTLVVTNTYGCDSSITKQVWVSGIPQADFLADTVCAQDNSTTFINNTVGGNSYIWDFGDGSPTSNAVNPTHTYSSGGTYNVSLIAENGIGCRDSIDKNIIVREKPVADFSATQVCLNKVTQFTNLTNIPTTNWNWDFGDGIGASTLENPTYVYSTNDTFLVTFISITQYGCSDTAIKDVIVMPNPTAAFVADTVCYTNPTTFTDLSSGAVSWNWDFGDGSSSTQQNPTHTYSNPDTISVELIVENIHGCLDTINKDVMILARPFVNFGYSPTVPTCARTSISFVDSTTGVVDTWTWDFGDGSSSTQQNPIHAYNNGGFYNINLVVSNSFGCSDSMQKTIQVYGLPTPDFVADTVCEGMPTSFTNLSQDTVPITSFWDFGDGNNSVAQNPQYIYADSGVYQVTLTITNSYGCDSSITKPVWVSAVPQADFVVDTACQSYPNTFTDNTSGYVNTWIWNFGDGTIDTTNSPVATHVYPQPGTYFVVMTAMNGSCMDAIAKPVSVVDSVNAEFVMSDSLICPGESISIMDISTGLPNAWLWDLGDGTSATTQNITSHTYPDSGLYTIKLTAANKYCSNTDSAYLYVMGQPQALFDFSNVCAGQPITFKNNSFESALPVNYIWYFGTGDTSTQAEPTYVYQNPGTYTVSLVIDNGRCGDSLAQTITVYKLPIAQASIQDTNTRIVEEVIFTDASIPGDAPINYWEWNINNGDIVEYVNSFSHTFTDTGHYPVMLVVRDDNSCADTAYYTVHVAGEFTVWIANAFTPNGDGLNDEFFPTGILYDIKSLDFRIYDRWGNLVFQTTEPGVKWDGRDQKTGKLVGEDAYVYVVIAVDYLGKEHKYVGTVTVMR